MNKNLTSNQVLLIALASILLLLAAFSFYLLQDLSAPLPFTQATSTSTLTFTPSTSPTPEATFTGTPTRQTSYTPFASPATPNPEALTQTPAAFQSVTPSPVVTLNPAAPTSSPAAPASRTPNPSPNTATISPASSPTLSAGEYGVSGRVVQNGTPLPNVRVDFEDDTPTRPGTTNQGGHYWFITLAPGTSFSLTFSQFDNPQVTPVSEVASLARLEGNLATGVNVIQVPDLDISLNVDGMLFDLQSPVDRTFYSAAIITAANPIEFIWSTYNGAQFYTLELGADGNDVPVWTSTTTTSTTLMWNGTLTDGTHITHGEYWWRVAATRPLSGYTLKIYTLTQGLTFTP